MPFQDEIESILRQKPVRVRSFEYEGKRFWLKRRETLGLRRRLQKGNASSAFDAERAAFERLSHTKVPIAKLAASGKDWLVIEDGGVSLREILHRDGVGAAENLPIFAAAGRALAAWHTADLAHGRPAIKDILWDGSNISFIDLERFSRVAKKPKRQVQDLVFFVISLLAVTQRITDELTVALDAYRDAGGEENFRNAQSFCRKLAWLKPILALVRYRKPGHGQDIRAILLTLDYFTR